MERIMSDTENFLKPLLDLMNKRMDDLSTKVDSNTSLTEQTLTQTRYTNGRVTKLEKNMADMQNRKSAHKLNVAPNIVYLVAVGSVVLLIIIATLLHINLGSIGL
jgi:hypothetical protein